MLYRNAYTRKFSPTADIPCFASRVDITASHTEPVRAFSAISSMIPRSIPRTHWLYHPVCGLNASTKPYLDHTFDPYARTIFSSTVPHGPGRNTSDPPAAHGTSVEQIVLASMRESGKEVAA